jgi:hypothetical protein
MGDAASTAGEVSETVIATLGAAVSAVATCAVEAKSAAISAAGLTSVVDPRQVASEAERREGIISEAVRPAGGSVGAPLQAASAAGLLVAVSVAVEVDPVAEAALEAVADTGK